MSSNTNLTFKQYLASKEKLREAIKNTPKQSVRYTVNKYCKLVVGESKEEKEYVNLKPKHTICVDWLYEDIDNPTPLKISFDTDQPHDSKTFWQGAKLMKWLNRNTHEESA